MEETVKKMVGNGSTENKVIRLAAHVARGQPGKNAPILIGGGIPVILNYRIDGYPDDINRFHTIRNKKYFTIKIDTNDAYKVPAIYDLALQLSEQYFVTVGGGYVQSKREVSFESLMNKYGLSQCMIDYTLDLKGSVVHKGEGNASMLEFLWVDRTNYDYPTHGFNNTKRFEFGEWCVKSYREEGKLTTTVDNTQMRIFGMFDKNDMTKGPSVHLKAHSINGEVSETDDIDMFLSGMLYINGIYPIA